MRLPHHDQRGTALVELALFVPLAIVMLGLATGVVNAVASYSRLNDVSGAAARYATRAALDPERPGVYRMRPTAPEVESYVRRLAGSNVESVTVTPDPSAALPGDQITVVIRMRSPLGPIGRAVNTVAGAFTGLFGAGPPLPPGGFTLESTTVMREE